MILSHLPPAKLGYISIHTRHTFFIFGESWTRTSKSQFCRLMNLPIFLSHKKRNNLLYMSLLWCAKWDLNSHALTNNRVWAYRVCHSAIRAYKTLILRLRAKPLFSFLTKVEDLLMAPPVGLEPTTCGLWGWMWVLPSLKETFHSAQSVALPTELQGHLWWRWKASRKPVCLTAPPVRNISHFMVGKAGLEPAR